MPMFKTNHYKKSISDFSLDQVLVGSLYGVEIQKKIHRFKFLHNYCDKKSFQEIFSLLFWEYEYVPDLIVYPPISLRDRIVRWPNHAKILANYCRELSHIQKICPFKKSIFAHHQSIKNKQERADVKEDIIFMNKHTDVFNGKKVLIIDDIITTGYTAHTLWKYIKEAGASEVVWWFLATHKV